MLKMSLSLVCMPFLFLLFFFCLLHIDFNDISTRMILTVYSSENCSKCFYRDSHSVLGISHFTDKETSSEVIWEGSTIA